MPKWWSPQSRDRFHRKDEDSREFFFLWENVGKDRFQRVTVRNEFCRLGKTPQCPRGAETNKAAGATCSFRMVHAFVSLSSTVLLAMVNVCFTNVTVRH